MVVICRKRASTTITERRCRPAVGGLGAAQYYCGAKKEPGSGRRFGNAAEGGSTFVIAPPTMVQAALRLIFLCVYHQNRVCFAIIAKTLYRCIDRCRVVSPFSTFPLYRMTSGCRVVLRFSAIPLYRIASGCRVVLRFSAISLYRIASGRRVVLCFSAIPLYRMMSECRVVLPFSAIPLYRATKRCRVVSPFSTVPLYTTPSGCRVVSPFSTIPLYKIRSRPAAGGLKMPPKAAPLS